MFIWDYIYKKILLTNIKRKLNLLKNINQHGRTFVRHLGKFTLFCVGLCFGCCVNALIFLLRERRVIRTC